MAEPCYGNDKKVFVLYVFIKINLNNEKNSLNAKIQYDAVVTK